MHLKHHIQQIDHHLRRCAGQLGHHLHQRFKRSFSERLLPCLFAHRELRLALGDVVQVLAIRAGLVDRIELALSVFTSHGNVHGLGHELLGQAQHQLTLDLAGHQKVVEQLHRQQRALLLLCQHSPATGGIGVQPTVFPGHAGHLPDAHHIVLGQVEHELRRSLVVPVAHLATSQCPTGEDGRAMRVIQLGPNLVHIHHLGIDGIFFHHQLVRAGLVQAAAHAVVQRFLGADQWQDGGVRQAGAAVAVGPHRDERECVMPEWRPRLDQRVLLGHDRAHDAP